MTKTEALLGAALACLAMTAATVAVAREDSHQGTTVSSEKKKARSPQQVVAATNNRPLPVPSALDTPMASGLSPQAKGFATLVGLIGLIGIAVWLRNRGAPKTQEERLRSIAAQVYTAQLESGREQSIHQTTADRIRELQAWVHPDLREKPELLDWAKEHVRGHFGYYRVHEKPLFDHVHLAEKEDRTVGTVQMTALVTHCDHYTNAATDKLARLEAYSQIQTWERMRKRGTWRLVGVRNAVAKNPYASDDDEDE